MFDSESWTDDVSLQSSVAPVRLPHSEGDVSNERDEAGVSSDSLTHLASSRHSPYSCGNCIVKQHVRDEAVGNIKLARRLDNKRVVQNRIRDVSETGNDTCESANPITI